MKNEKIVLITGASSGIGAATVDKVLEAGHKQEAATNSMKSPGAGVKIMSWR